MRTFLSNKRIAGLLVSKHPCNYNYTRSNPNSVTTYYCGEPVSANKKSLGTLDGL